MATERALSLHGVALGCWSRLLAMKRPDLFLSVNNANRAQLRAVFGSAPTSPKAYTKLLGRIRAFPWAMSPRPEVASGEEYEIWEARVAMLDTVLYEPVGASN